MKKISILSGAALLAVAGGVAFAQAGPGQRPDPQADLTRDQVVARTNEAFARLDANRDGRFTPDEARAMRDQRRTERVARMFERLDANHDGNIGREEFGQAATRRGERRAEGGPGMGRRGMGRFRGPPPGGPDRPEGGPGGPGGPGGRMFGEQGFVTLDQMRERALARFDRADANHDGTLTAAERREARGHRREHMRERRRPS